ncbi:SseB family protein [Bacillus bingmayongensis]|uniref:SseB family protein n=1 Tax=Bacillus bingmayongensis TaxID=1150157 RepID=UPI001C8F1737|nr:SseB family protein [Bacillus bingmayongensis]MBY0599220.1 SseB family protein [Bacillus bingmayongensis]
MSLLEICPLDEALVEALQNEEKRGRFYDILQKSNLYVVASVEGDTNTDEDGNLISTDNTQLQIHYFEMEEGLMLPLYSDLKHLEMVIPEDCPYVCMNAVELLQTVDLEANVILNLGTPFQKLFVKEEIEAICDGSIFDIFSKEV